MVIVFRYSHDGSVDLKPSNELNPSQKDKKTPFVVGWADILAGEL
jgi:hypothetical protein